jgi:hypothetical protein
MVYKKIPEWSDAIVWYFRLIKEKSFKESLSKNDHLHLEFQIHLSEKWP